MIERLTGLLDERPPEDATERQKEQLRLKAIIEKKAGINLIEAFA